MSESRDDDASFLAGLAAVSDAQWDELSAALDALDGVTTFAMWAGGQVEMREVDGVERPVTHVPYPEYTPEVERLRNAIGRCGLIVPYDWMAWDGIERYRDGLGLAGAPPADAVRMITAIMRSERFGDGNIEGALKCGTLQAAIERLLVRGVPQTDAMAWDGDDYQARFDRLAATGTDVHGEATFVRAYEPATVLDAGCGTGRVAMELSRHGIEVTGVDVDASMLATAQRLAPDVTWAQADLTTLDLGRTFDLVVMAGNVPLFTPRGTQAALVTGVARHVASGGVLIAGFSLDRGYGVDDYDAHATAAGLSLAERFATWDRAPWADGGEYAVSVHRR